MTDDANKTADADQWWITTESGRQIGYMWPEEMYAILQSIWGTRNGIIGFCEWTGMARGTVERYCNGKRPIPKFVAMLVKSAERMAIIDQPKKFQGMGPRFLPKDDADWLPNRTYERLVDRPPFEGYG